MVLITCILKWRLQDFPGGPGIGGLSANAEDMYSLPGRGRFHLLWGNLTCVPQSLSLLFRGRAPQEKPPQLESSPCSLQSEKPCLQQGRPRAAKKIFLSKMKVVLVAGAPSSSLSGSHTSLLKFRLGSPAVSLLASTYCQKSSDTFLNLVFGSLNPATVLDKRPFQLWRL